MIRGKRLLLQTLAVVMLNLLPVLYISTRDPHVWIRSGGGGWFNRDTIEEKPRDTKLILFLDFPEYYELAQAQGPEGLARCNTKDEQGKEMRCQITVDRRRFSQADAVVFFTHHKVNMDQLGFPPTKLPGTTWTYFAVESPLFSNSKLFDEPAFHDKFNSTMTYRTDSEFWHGYVRSQRRSEPLDALTLVKEEAQLRAAFRNKTKMAAIFVSHCSVPSRRDVYIRQLKKYLEVDVFGKCGSLKCNDEDACIKMLDRDYKFYLAFENSLCVDYVTEKLLKVMRSRRVVPVVRGGADYRRLFPENSLVDTSSFISASHLARYLKRLAKDEDKWVKKFQWFSHWKVESAHLPLCEYCHSLYTAKRSFHLYHNVHRWWTVGTCYPAQDL